MPIRVLEPQVAAKIAAGEVVERPSSVVKELVENAIDAGATIVQIEIRNGGLELIRVVDNGCGIPQEEIELAFQRHATSKISGLEDLQAVRTLGFRGEALYSIAAVAQVTLCSRPAHQAAAAFLDIADGQVKSRGQRGAPVGTTVTVRNLFYNVPARRKFLKSPEVEGARIINLVYQFALAYPELHFYLVNNGRQAFQSTGSGSLYDALVKVYGLETAKQMIEIPTFDLLSLSVWGYVSQPHLNRANRSYISFFVNRRWVQSPMLTRAVEEAYHTLLPVGRYPIAVLNITMPPEELDVNVHPAKAEVKFLREGDVFTAVQRAVRSALMRGAAIPEFGPVATARADALRPMPGMYRPQTTIPAAALMPSGQVTEVHGAPEGEVAVQTTTEGKLPPLRIIGQMAQTYIVAEAPDGMYLIDQHTAHERILYDRLMAEHARMAVKSQLLLEPLTLELSSRQQAILQPRLGALAELGFQLEPFGERTYLVRAIPAVLQPASALQAILEIIDLLSDERLTPANWREGLYITLACHGAVRAGQTLTMEEMRQLVLQLEQTSLPRTCPHGRPTLLHISQAQLEREFGRR